MDSVLKIAGLSILALLFIMIIKFVFPVLTALSRFLISYLGLLVRSFPMP